MDAIQLLKEDHERLRSLLDEAEHTRAQDATQRRKCYRLLRAELQMHEQLEETLLYPALKEHEPTRALTLEGYQEHHTADLLLNELYTMDVADENWGPKLKVLKEIVEHHIDEEEDELFPKAKKVLSHDRLRQMGARMMDIEHHGVRRAA